MITKQLSAKPLAASFSDEELLPALKSQDGQAIKYLYHSHWPMILQFVKVNSGDEDQAKDLYQDGILDFLEKVWSGKLVLTCKIKTFIYSICRNKWLHQLRQKQKFVDIEEYIIMDKLREEKADEEPGLPNDEQIRLAINSLGQPCQALLIGFYYEGLKLEQLAEKLQYKSVNVVKQQKFRCKDRLKQALTTRKISEP